MFLKINRDYVIALILAIITLGICVCKISYGWQNWSDDAAYISQAIALANGEVAQYIADNTLMMTKSDWLIGPYAYPWGFPVLLAMAYKIFGFNIVAFKSVGIMCYAIFVGIFYIFCANRIPRIYAIFATLLFALNPYMTSFVANEIYSDTPFMLFGFVALIILAKLFGKSPRDNGIAIAIFGGIFMLFATMIRINGFVIVCALIAMHGIMILKRFAPKIFTTKILKQLSHIDSPYSWKINAIPYAIFIVGFAIVSITLSSGGGGHFGALADINIKSILHNLYSYTMRFSQFFELNERDFAILAICLAPFLLLGIRECLKSAESSANLFYAIFALGFFTLLILWLESFGLRFVFILLPFLIFWSVMGFSASKKIYSYAMGVILLFILGGFAYLNVVDFAFKDKIGRHSNIISGKYSQETMQIWEVIKQNTPQDSIIISLKPRATYLNTHRRSFATAKIERLDEADFVLWWAEYEKLNIFSPEFQSKTQLIFQNAEYKLFKVLK